MSANKDTNSISIMNIKVDPFGEIDSEKVLLFTLHNSSGNSANIINYGGIITSLTVPDKRGKIKNIVLGYDNLDDYLQDQFYFGAIIGRYCNRIAKGQFSLDNKQYKLSINSNNNHIHGGKKGFDKVVWNAKPIKGDDYVGIEMFYLSKDMEEEDLLENTLIVFSSDNGPVLNDGYYDDAVEKIGNHTPSGSFQGGKYSLFEAGIHVPFFTYWKGKIKPASSDALVSQVDLLSSLANW